MYHKKESAADMQWTDDGRCFTAPPVRLALETWAAQGVFTGLSLCDEWYRAYIGWWRQRHGFAMEKDWLLYCAGVKPALSCILRALTGTWEKVLLLTPADRTAAELVRSNGRQVVPCPLQYSGGTYRVDFAQLERQLSDPQLTMLLLDNPHSPTGTVWEHNTLEQIGALCKKYDVTVLSDETGCDLTDPGCTYIPFASVSAACRDNSVTCISPEKPFCLHGLQTAAAVIPNERLRRKVQCVLHTEGIEQPNAFAVPAVTASFTQGADWLDSRCAAIWENKKAIREFIDRELPELRVLPSKAGTVVRLDCANVIGCIRAAVPFIPAQAGIHFADSAWYGNGQADILEINAECPKDRLPDRLRCFRQGMLEYEQAVIRQC